MSVTIKKYTYNFFVFQRQSFAVEHSNVDRTTVRIKLNKVTEPGIWARENLHISQEC